MRIDLTLLSVLIGTLSCACPGNKDTSTQPPGGSAPSPAPGGENPGGENPGGENPGGEDPGGARGAAVPSSHPQYQRVEGTSFQNGCSSDDQCHVGGCSSEVCSAEEGVNSTCEAPADGWPTTGATCGCVKGECIWYKSGSASAPTSPPTEAAAPAQGEPCSTAGKCAQGLTCVKYYGIAGPKGPEMKSCEIRCDAGCPSGQTCTTIADGPGQVCRPAQ